MGIAQGWWEFWLSRLLAWWEAKEAVMTAACVARVQLCPAVVTTNCPIQTGCCGRCEV